MRPQQNRRVRGRNNNNSNNNNNRRGPNPLSRNYESSGPDVKIRGNAQQIADKYISLARDAQGAGDRVMSENYLQHAEHYLRIILAAVGQTQYARRDENRDENNEQECSEINVEVEKKDTINCETDVAQTPLQKMVMVNMLSCKMDMCVKKHYKKQFHWQQFLRMKKNSKSNVAVKKLLNLLEKHAELHGGVRRVFKKEHPLNFHILSFHEQLPKLLRMIMECRCRRLLPRLC